ncbi:tRNA-dihydrouridine synthase [Patescibacteria group bacterium]|nr:tRNA-dihydrouridine synthase [Patescibacteria group bacterium]
MSNFWKKIKENKNSSFAEASANRPFFALAPMLDVTDSAFREIVAKYGKPDVLWTEFVSCDGMCSEGKEKLMHLLHYTEKQRPIVAQLFGSNPENFKKTARIVAELGYDGIDINMGCPQKTILKQGAGACLISTPDLAREIIRATKKGAGDLPVSVKTRIGYKEDTLEEWLPVIIEEKPVAITVHGRTQKEMSQVPARWDRIKKAVEMAKGTGIIMIGNGDVKSIEEGIERAKESGVDGVMIGRGIFGNPWLFSRKCGQDADIYRINAEKFVGTEYLQIDNDLDTGCPSIEEKLGVLIEHIELYEKYYAKEYKEGDWVFKSSRSDGRIKPFNMMKKHIGAYVKEFKGAKELRMELMETESEKEAVDILKKYLRFKI